MQRGHRDHQGGVRAARHPGRRRVRQHRPTGSRSFRRTPVNSVNMAGADILRGAGVIFFAYIGFDAVSTAAQEARNPQRDMPIGILGSLVVCTILYVLVSCVMVRCTRHSARRRGPDGGRHRRRESPGRRFRIRSVDERHAVHRQARRHCGPQFRDGRHDARHSRGFSIRWQTTASCRRGRSAFIRVSGRRTSRRS